MQNISVRDIKNRDQIPRDGSRSEIEKELKVLREERNCILSVQKEFVVFLPSISSIPITPINAGGEKGNREMVKFFLSFYVLK